MKLLIAGGGTGGHVIPAIAVAREWLRRGTVIPESGQGGREVVIVGTARGLESKLVPRAGLPLETIRAAGLKGMGFTKLVKNAAMLVPGFLDSAAILRRHHFVAAFGVGGYASGPMMLVAMLKSIPSVVFEPNAEPGLTNRLLGGIATRVAVGFESSVPRWGSRGILTGCPVRKEFFNAPVRQHVPPFRIFITGGSSGAHIINQTVINSLDLWISKKNQVLVVHQTGERDYNAVRDSYAQRGFQAEVSSFIENMAEQFAQADLIVCRAGAITVAEITAAGRAAIFIPFGAATDAHQLHNARALEAVGAARVLPQNELTPERLTREIFSLLDQPQKLAEMEVRACALARPHAVEDIVDLLEQISRKDVPPASVARSGAAERSGPAHRSGVAQR